MFLEYITLDTFYVWAILINSWVRIQNMEMKMLILWIPFNSVGSSDSQRVEIDCDKATRLMIYYGAKYFMTRFT